MYIRGGGYKKRKRKRGSGNLGRSKSTWTPSYLLNRFPAAQIVGFKKGGGMSFRGGGMSFAGSGMSFHGGGGRVFTRRGTGKRLI